MPYCDEPAVAPASTVLLLLSDTAGRSAPIASSRGRRASRVPMRVRALSTCSRCGPLVQIRYRPLAITIRLPAPPHRRPALPHHPTMAIPHGARLYSGTEPPPNGCADRMRREQVRPIAPRSPPEGEKQRHARARSGPMGGRGITAAMRSSCSRSIHPLVVCRCASGAAPR